MEANSIDLVGRIREAVASAGRTPIYQRIAEELERAIADGSLPPGSALPGEPEFASSLGISRQTLGRALGEVAKRGQLDRRRGVGTFVTGRAVEQPLDRLYSFVQSLSVDGSPATSRLLGARLVVNPEIAALLNVPDPELIFEISRLFLVDDAPFVYERIFLPAEPGGRLPYDRLATAVIYDLLRELCDIEVTHGEETLSFARLGREAASLLRMQSGDPAFLIERIAYAGDKPIEIRRSLVRADRSRFRLKLAGPVLTPSEVPDAEAFAR